MSQPEIYELWFDAFRPETIPMGRLAAYLVEFARLLGSPESVHFQEVRPGSTAPVALVEVEAVPKVAARLSLVGSVDAAEDANKAYKALDSMIRADNAIGRLTKQPVGGKRCDVLDFPGRNTPEPEQFGPFNQQMSVEGELIRIGGRDSTAHVQLQDQEGRTWLGEVTRAMAQEMAPCLYKGPILRIDGRARLFRSADGKWECTDFKVQSFEVLERESLLVTAQRLRSFAATGWSKLDDVDRVLEQERGLRDDLH